MVSLTQRAGEQSGGGSGKNVAYEHLGFLLIGFSFPFPSLMSWSQAWVGEKVWKLTLWTLLLRCASCILVLAPLCVGTDCRSISTVTRNWQLLPTDCYTGGLLLEKFMNGLKWLRCHFPQVPTAQWHALHIGSWLKRPLINELVRVIYFFCAKTEVINLCEDMAVTKVLLWEIPIDN